MEQFQSAITVRKRKARGRIIISVTEEIDDDELTERAGKRAVMMANTDDIEKRKGDLAERSVLEAVKREAPEAFDPETSTTLRFDSDHDVDLQQ